MATKNWTQTQRIETPAEAYERIIALPLDENWEREFTRLYNILAADLEFQVERLREEREIQAEREQVLAAIEDENKACAGILEDLTRGRDQLRAYIAQRDALGM
jgi:hypothetical protein